MAQPQMTPEEMDQLQKQASKNNDAPVTQLIQQGGEVISKLAEMINQSDATTDEDRQKISEIMNLYASLVEGMQQESGKNPEQPEMADQGAVPMEQGMKGMPMGPQSRQ